MKMMIIIIIINKAIYQLEGTYTLLFQKEITEIWSSLCIGLYNKIVIIMAKELLLLLLLIILSPSNSALHHYVTVDVRNK